MRKFVKAILIITIFSFLCANKIKAESDNYSGGTIFKNSSECTGNYCIVGTNSNYLIIQARLYYLNVSNFENVGKTYYFVNSNAYNYLKNYSDLNVIEMKQFNNYSGDSRYFNAVRYLNDYLVKEENAMEILNSFVSPNDYKSVLIKDIVRTNGSKICRSSTGLTCKSGWKEVAESGAKACQYEENAKCESGWAEIGQSGNKACRYAQTASCPSGYTATGQSGSKACVKIEKTSSRICKSGTVTQKDGRCLMWDAKNPSDTPTTCSDGRQYVDSQCWRITTPTPVVGKSCTAYETPLDNGACRHYHYAECPSGYDIYNPGDGRCYKSTRYTYYTYSGGTNNPTCKNGGGRLVSPSLCGGAWSYCCAYPHIGSGTSSTYPTCSAGSPVGEGFQDPTCYSDISKTCPDGYTDNGNGTCSISGDAACGNGGQYHANISGEYYGHTNGAGSYVDLRGKCHSDGNTGTCPSGTLYFYMSGAIPVYRCKNVCPTGYFYSNGKCLQDRYIGPTECPSGYEKSGNDCIKKHYSSRTVCPSGYERQGETCYKYKAKSVCKSGYEQKGDKCYSYQSKTECPTGWTTSTSNVTKGYRILLEPILVTSNVNGGTNTALYTPKGIAGEQTTKLSSKINGYFNQVIKVLDENLADSNSLLLQKSEAECREYNNATLSDYRMKCLYKMISVDDYISPNGMYTCYEKNIKADGELACYNWDKNNDMSFSESYTKKYCYDSVDERKRSNIYGKTVLEDIGTCRLYCKETAAISLPGNITLSKQKGTYFTWPSTVEGSDYRLNIKTTMKCTIVDDGGGSTTISATKVRECPAGTTNHPTDPDKCVSHAATLKVCDKRVTEEIDGVCYSLINPTNTLASTTDSTSERICSQGYTATGQSGNKACAYTVNATCEAGWTSTGKAGNKACKKTTSERTCKSDKVKISVSAGQMRSDKIAEYNGKCVTRTAGSYSDASSNTTYPYTKTCTSSRRVRMCVNKGVSNNTCGKNGWIWTYGVNYGTDISANGNSCTCTYASGCYADCYGPGGYTDITTSYSCTDYSRPVTTYSCPSGTTMWTVGGKKMCRSGCPGAGRNYEYHPTGNINTLTESSKGYCVDNPEVPSECPSGYTKEGSTCVAYKAKTVCQSGYVLSGDKCIYYKAKTECPSGWTKSGNNCVKTVSPYCGTQSNKNSNYAVVNGQYKCCPTGTVKSSTNPSKCRSTVSQSRVCPYDKRDNDGNLIEYYSTGNVCLEIKSKSNGEYTCPEGFTLNGKTCTNNCTAEVKENFKTRMQQKLNEPNANAILEVNGSNKQINDQLVIYDNKVTEVESDRVYKNGQLYSFTFETSLYLKNKDNINRFFNKITQEVDKQPGPGYFDRGEGVISLSSNTKMFSTGSLINDYKLDISIIKNIGVDNSFDNLVDNKKYSCQYRVTDRQDCKCLEGTKNAGDNAYELYANVVYGVFGKKISANTDTTFSCPELQEKYCNYDFSDKQAYCTDCSNNKKNITTCVKDKLSSMTLEKAYNVCSKQVCLTDSCDNYCTNKCRYIDQKVGNTIYSILKCNGDTEICNFELRCTDERQTSQSYLYLLSERLNTKNIVKYIDKNGESAVSNIETALRSLDSNICGIRKNSKVVYRVIDLKNPFPSKDGNSRIAGNNWNSENIINKTIKNARGAAGDQLFKKEPILTITLTPNSIKKIRNYNDNTKYNDNSLNCINNDSVGCISSFVHGNSEYSLKSMGLLSGKNNCINLSKSSSLTSFNSCYNSNN